MMKKTIVYTFGVIISVTIDAHPKNNLLVLLSLAVELLKITNTEPTPKPMFLVRQIGFNTHIQCNNLPPLAMANDPSNRIFPFRIPYRTGYT